jgi:hypothetical protein
VVDINRGVEEVFGPVPAIAATPFLGLAVLTGAALLTDQPAIAGSNSLFVQRLRRNALVLEAKTYASGWLVGALFLLALISGLANSGKLQGALGKFFRSTEDFTSGIAYLVIAISALTSTQVTALLAPPPPSMLFASVIPPFELGTLALVVTACVSLAALMLVRFALDLLIWINPVPFIDLVFESGKTVFSLVFLAIYFISPVLAALLGVVILIPALLLLPWALRFMGFVYRIVFCPILSRISPAFAPSLVDPALARACRGHEVALACRATVLKARGLKKRQAVALMYDGSRVMLHPIRRQKRARGLCEPEEEVLLGRALAWIELRVVDGNGQTLDRLALPRSLASEFERLRVLLGARDVGDMGAMKVLNAAGRAARESIDSAARVVNPRTEAQ